MSNLLEKGESAPALAMDEDEIELAKMGRCDTVYHVTDHLMSVAQDTNKS
jgi:hypothetical protein